MKKLVLIVLPLTILTLGCSSVGPTMTLVEAMTDDYQNKASDSN